MVLLDMWIIPKGEIKMTEEYDSPIWDIPPKYICPNPDYGLSVALKENDYDSFIRTFSYEVRKMGKVDIENITVICEGKCPNGCEKKFKLKLGKSITKKSFDKMYKHGEKYPYHCINTKFNGVIKNGI